MGSANLTNGLAANIEAATYFEGRKDEPVLSGAWRWAESLWGDEVKVEYWDRGARERKRVPQREVLEPELLAALSLEARRDPNFRTLGSHRPNKVVEVTPHAVYVETEKTRAERQPPQPVDAWMLNLAWNFLRTHGTLTNTYLLNELRVHRSSAVCAMLARLPPAEVVPGKAIALRWRGAPLV